MYTINNDNMPINLPKIRIFIFQERDYCNSFKNNLKLYKVMKKTKKFKS